MKEVQPDFVNQNKKEAPGYRDSYTIMLPRESAVLFSEFVIPIVVWEVGKGERSNLNDKKTDDILDQVMRETNIISQYENYGHLSLSPAGIDKISDHFEKYIHANKLSDDKVDDGNRVILEMKQRLKAVQNPGVLIRQNEKVSGSPSRDSFFDRMKSKFGNNSKGRII